MFQSRFFQSYLLPGFVFQSVVIGGGYGTGRELVQFFLKYGTLGGLLGMCLVSTVIWSAVAAVTFEFARMTRSYEYRKFCRELLGRFWWLFEICYLLIIVIVLSVIAAAAGSIVQEIFSAPYYVGVVFMMFAIGFLVLKGSALVEKFFAFWSFVLYAVYILFFVACFRSFGPAIVAGLETMEVKPGWFQGGLEYAAYNVAALPAVLFCIRHLNRRKEALISGLLAGPIAIIPGSLFFVAMTGDYPHILSEIVPSVYLLNRVGSTLLLFAYQITLFGTLVETGTGLIHSFNERIASSLEEKGRKMKSATRPLVAMGLLLLAALLAPVGLENLIAKGYGTVTYAFWAVFLLPVLTWGLYRIFTGDSTSSAKLGTS